MHQSASTRTHACVMLHGALALCFKRIGCSSVQIHLCKTAHHIPFLDCTRERKLGYECLVQPAISCSPFSGVTNLRIAQTLQATTRASASQGTKALRLGRAHVKTYMNAPHRQMRVDGSLCAEILWESENQNHLCHTSTDQIRMIHHNGVQVGVWIQRLWERHEHLCHACTCMNDSCIMMRVDVVCMHCPFGSMKYKLCRECTHLIALREYMCVNGSLCAAKLS